MASGDHEAGGGAYAEVLLNTRSGQASADIAAHILGLSFGSRWSDQTDAFVEIFFAYRKAGLFRLEFVAASGTKFGRCS